MTRGGAPRPFVQRNRITGIMHTSTETNAARLLSGSCLCGAVRYTVSDEFRYALNCHCSNCRRATGAAFKPLAGIERVKFRISEGEGKLLVFGEPNAHDARCGTCGSLLYSLVRDGEFIHVAMGTLIDAPSVRPAAHIFAASKAPWYDITDALPQHDEFG